MTSPISPNGYMAEQLVGINTKITDLQAQRVTYVAGEVSGLNIGNSTFSADIDQPDGTGITVTGIRSSPQFLPAINNVVTLALSGAQVIYMPFGVAAGSIDNPQLSPTVTGSISNAVSTANSASGAATTAQTTANNAQTTANNAQNTANTKITTFYAGVAPSSGMVLGDLWINTGSNNTLYRYSGSTWVQIQDQQIQSALVAAGTAQATADGKVQTFYQTAAPTTGMGVGDLWFDTDDGNKNYRYSGTAWVLVQDQSIAAALAAANSAQATANTKVLVFAQPTAPTAQEVGDIWFETDNGNRMSIWGPTPTVTRINYALNPSFEADTSGTKTVIQSWNNYTSGSTGTVTRSIVTTGGVANGTKAVKSSSSSQAATVGVGHGYQQSYVAAQGNIFRVQAVFQLATTGANFVPHLQIEPLNSGGTVLAGTVTASGSGTSTGGQTLNATTAALPANTASVRVTLQRRTAATSGSALATSDITIDAVLVEKNRDSAAATTYFDGDTPATGTDNKWDNPTGAPNSTSTYWAPGVAGVNAWQPQQLRTAAIAVQSILGNDCIAYGSITAPLLESLLVLTGTVIAGDPNADHAALMTDGLHLYRQVVGEGLQETGSLAVGSFGTSMAFVDSSGKQVALIDESGNASFTGANIDTDPVLMGTAFTDWLNSASNSGATNPFLNGQTMAGAIDGSIASVTTETGLAEIPVFVDKSRWYMLGFETSLIRSDPSTEGVVRVRDGGTGSPTTSSPEIMYRQCSDGVAGYGIAFQKYGFWQPSTTGQHRLLLTVEASAAVGGFIGIDTINSLCAIYCIDMGPRGAGIVFGQLNRGGGGTPAPPQPVFVEAAPTGHWSYRGDGTLRTDTTDVVQGTDPSGFNGDGKGGWNFTIPNITSGKVDRVDLYLYNNWSFYNSGGDMLIRPVTSANTASPTQLQSFFRPGFHWPKPGPVTVTLPSSWNNTFAGKTSIGIYVGPSSLVNANDETFYVRPDGPAPRLRIWYHT